MKIIKKFFIKNNMERELQELLTKYYQKKIEEYVQSFGSSMIVKENDYKEEIEYLVEKALNQDSGIWEQIAERYYS